MGWILLESRQTVRPVGTDARSHELFFSLLNLVLHTTCKGGTKTCESAVGGVRDGDGKWGGGVHATCEKTRKRDNRDEEM